MLDPAITIGLTVTAMVLCGISILCISLGIADIMDAKWEQKKTQTPGTKWLAAIQETEQTEEPDGIQH